MTGTIIFCLFILNVLTILVIVVLYSRQNKLLTMEKELRKNMEESEKVITAFLMEIREENNNLIKFIQNRKDGEDIREASVPPFEETDKSVQDGTSSFATPSYQKMKAMNVYDSQIVEEVESLLQPNKKDEDIQEVDELLEEVLKLQEGGMDAGQIARQLQKGKTEIDLLLKFYKQS